MLITAKEFVKHAKKIVAVARNYKAHAAELGNAVPEKPMFFMKPTSSFITQGESIKMPKSAATIDYEVELGVIIGKTCKEVTPQKAMQHVAGYCLALDMTDRTFQKELQAKAYPWFLAKGFDTSCPVSDFIEAERVADPHALTLWLEVNGVLRQRGSTSQMIYPIGDLLAYVTRFVTLEPGDVLLTGTPQGVGPVKRGDKITCGLDGFVEMTFPVE